MKTNVDKDNTAAAAAASDLKGTVDGAT